MWDSVPFLGDFLVFGNRGRRVVLEEMGKAGKIVAAAQALIAVCLGTGFIEHGERLLQVGAGPILGPGEAAGFFGLSAQNVPTSGVGRKLHIFWVQLVEPGNGFYGVAQREVGPADAYAHGIGQFAVLADDLFEDSNEGSSAALGLIKLKQVRGIFAHLFGPSCGVGMVPSGQQYVLAWAFGELAVRDLAI